MNIDRGIGTFSTASSLSVAMAAGIVGTGFLACSSDTYNTIMTKDSSGVTVVELPALARESRALEVTTRRSIVSPSAGRGLLESVTDIDVAPNGHLVVLDRLARNIKVFDTTGTLAGLIGTPGNGDGAVSTEATRIFVGPDSTIRLAEPNARRIQRFDLQGTYLGSDKINPASGMMRRWDTDRNGNLYYESRANPFENASPDLRTDVVLWSTLHDDRPLFELGREVGLDNTGKGQWYGAKFSWGVFDDGTFVVGDGKAYELRFISATGSVTRVVHVRNKPVPIDDTDRATLYDEVARHFAKQSGPVPPFAHNPSQFLSLPEHYPEYVNLVTDDNDRVWVQRPVTGNYIRQNAPDGAFGLETGSPEWDVFTRGGRYVGSVALPAGLTLMRVKQNAVYGFMLDPDGNPTVTVLNIFMDPTNGAQSP